MDTPSQFFNDAACDDSGRDGYFGIDVPILKSEPDVEDASSFLNPSDDVLLAAQLNASKPFSRKAAPNGFDDLSSGHVYPQQLKLDPDMVAMNSARRSQRQNRESTTTVDSQGSSTARSTPPALDQHSSRSTDPSAEPPPPTPKKQKRGKNASSSSTQPAKKDPKRDVFLQRNRMAASKCRQKKKEWMSDLQETKQDLENQHMQLLTEYNMLVGEVTSLKDQLMSHATCNDRNIDLWLEAEARRFAHKASKQFNEANQVPRSKDSIRQAPLPGPMVMPPDHMVPATTATRLSQGVMPLDPSFVEHPDAAVGREINYDHMPGSMFEDSAQEYHRC
ncbi:hypothetical protein ACHAQA_004947 [Verticillium albo-atrum]